MSTPSTASLPLSSPGGSEDGRSPKSTNYPLLANTTPGKAIAIPQGVGKRNDSVGSEKEEVDEALNFEYLRNVLLEFLEKPAMRVSSFSSLLSSFWQELEMGY